MDVVINECRRYRRDFKVGFLAGRFAGLGVRESIVLGTLLREDEEKEEFCSKRKKRP